tara:strand:- start:10551 stop:10721 length:171 start_codon:yes stop_codon:yes gene_type:complete
MSSEGAEFRLPLEFPTAEYDEQYMQRLINQLRLIFELIPSSTEVEDDASANAWFMS